MGAFQRMWRRTFVIVTLMVVVSGCKMGVTVVEPSGSAVDSGAQSVNLLQDSSAINIQGETQRLDQYLGKVALVVNTASDCGFTGQYEGLEMLYDRYGERGFVVLGFPCNDFGGQEPGTEAEIQGFCSAEFNVSFPMFSKIHVVGTEKHPFYKKLTEQSPKETRGDVTWNFTKFLLDKKGRVVARFAPYVTPESDEVVAAIEKFLSVKD